MKKRSLILLIFFCGLPVSAPGKAQENAQRFVAAMAAYKSQDYAKAIREMEFIARSGVQNSALYYNLGNAYLKANRLGHAILWYERALRLRPNDPDLRFNADYARSLTRDAADDDAASLLRIFFFWKYRLSQRTIVLLAAGFNLLFWSVLIGKRISGRRSLHYIAMVAAVPCILFVFTSAVNYYEMAHAHQGIVLDDRVPIRSGLDETATELFVLHAGAQIRVVKENRSHLKIRFGRDKIGWIDRAAVGRI